MNINILNIISVIFIVLALWSSPLLVVQIKDNFYFFPTYNLPENISNFADFFFNLLHLIITLLLFFTIIILLVYAFLNRKSSLGVAVLGIIIAYVVISSFFFALASSANPMYSFTINPAILYLLLAYMLANTSDIYGVYLVTPEGNRVPLTLSMFKKRKSKSKYKPLSEKPLVVEKEEEEAKKEEAETEKKEEEKEKKEEKKEEIEKKPPEEKVLSEIAKEILRG